MTGEPEQPEPPERSIELDLLDLLDLLRDSFNVQIECAMNDIRRLMKNKERGERK